jgi:hypothetical protein
VTEHLLIGAARLVSSDDLPDRCRCGRDAGCSLDDWFGRYEGGRLESLICPSCQVPEDHAEVAVRNAMVCYWYMHGDGRWYERLYGEPASEFTAG